ncbi:hypothetical protein [Sphingomonas sp. PP-CE-1G-424]|uniref:hypothetical protein n=1 Tax=Sphingomonas sp. PP-CE-1G-424 TaxID=2135658 RepID=UPI00105633A7|nr:hypothetical protein [Sphingomonas sp. PP-CE-1G-424]TCP65404.1 hypothetical protein C8J43_11260 [Sphingomonas sp. PP-CE-1G-424]
MRTLRIATMAAGLLASVELASGQADRFGATPAEFRAATKRIASLEADFASLSQKYGVPKPTLRAIARGQIRAMPTLGGGELRETVRKLALDAAKLRVQLASLRTTALGISGPSGINDDQPEDVAGRLARASALIDSGDLSAAGRILAEITPGSTAAVGRAGRLWVDVVKATALTQFLAGDLAAADETLRSASGRLKVEADDYRWELEYERGLRLVQHGHAKQDMQAVMKAVAILETEALPLTAIGSRQRLRTLTEVCSGRTSLLSETVASTGAANILSTLQILLDTCGAAASIAEQSSAGTISERGTALTLHGIAFVLACTINSEQAGIKGAFAQMRRGLAMLRAGSDKEALRIGLIIYGDALNIQGSATNDRGMLDDATRQYGSVVELTDRMEVPGEWAAAQQRLAGGYAALAGLNGQPATFRRAIDGYRRAAEIFTRAYSDPAWAGNVVMTARTEAALSRITGDYAGLRASEQDLRSAERILATSGSTTKQEEAGELLSSIERSGVSK